MNKNLFGISALILALSAAYYLVVFIPEKDYQKLLLQKNEMELKSSIEKAKLLPTPTCTDRAWSVSKQEFICYDYKKLTKEQALAECSKNFGAILITGKIRNTTIENVQKSKDFWMQLCMEQKGFQY